MEIAKSLHIDLLIAMIVKNNWWGEKCQVRHSSQKNTYVNTHSLWVVNVNARLRIVTSNLVASFTAWAASRSEFYSFYGHFYLALYYVSFGRVNCETDNKWHISHSISWKYSIFFSFKERMRIAVTASAAGCCQFLFRNVFYAFLIWKSKKKNFFFSLFQSLLLSRCIYERAVSSLLRVCKIRV